MGISENAAYLKGLAEGMNLDSNSNEGKIIVKMLDLIEEMSEKINILESQQEELYSYMEGMAEDLVNIENDLYSEADSDFEDYSDLNDGEDEYSDEEYYEVECPSCGEKICFTEEFDLDNFMCPACGNKIDDIELVDDCSSCSGDCAGCSGADCI